MKRPRMLLALAALGSAVAAGSFLAGSAAAMGASRPAKTGAAAVASHVVSHPVKPVCPPPRSRGVASCLALQRTDIKPRKVLAPAAAPAGYGPADLRAAYALPSAGAAGGTVAIVDAFDDPSAGSDLATYRSQFGLPACTTGNGCFQKVNQEGQQGHYPPANAGWAVEESLDVDMASAVCPNCHIILVEANTNNGADLYAAEDEAVKLGAKFVSNSWAGCEYASETSDDRFFNHPGVAITAGSGDWGYLDQGIGCNTLSYPAASQYVTAVGGTTLTRDSSSARGWSETTWSGTGSGCSGLEVKPAWQTDAGCANRTDGDVAAVADPDTGVAVFDSGAGGWIVLGGTSVATPVIASVYALAGTPATGTYPASYPYDKPSALHDVTSGSDGTCTPSYLCTAGPGYDGPTGLGTPNGIAAFGFGPHGDIAGTVTDKTTGQPLTGATVSTGDRHTRTNSRGRYDLNEPVGTYQVTASAYGYHPDTVSGVSVTAKATTTENIALSPLPHVTVTGVVTDGSGHGWPLYAKVTSSDGSTAFTNPATGRYSLPLLDNASYTLTVTTPYPGYPKLGKKITVGTANMTQDFSLPMDAFACAAPGHRLRYSGTAQRFGGTSAPAGWAVRNANHQPGWAFNNPGQRKNHTGGSGGFAIADSTFYGQNRDQDTSLTSPAVDMSADAKPVVQFASDLNGNVFADAAVDVSTNGGRTWATVWDRGGSPGARGPGLQVIPLPRAAHQRDVRVRFRYFGTWHGWWEIDNVFLGNRACVRQSGGMLVGQVTDASTGTGLDGATVASATHPAVHATTIATPGDPALNGGFYWLFSPQTGQQAFTASEPGYQSATATAAVQTNQVTRLDFALTASTATASSGRKEQR